MKLIRYTTPSLNAWSPFDPLDSFRQEVNRLFDRRGSVRSDALFSSWSPALDLFEEEDRLVATFELPGFTKDAINISLHDGTLTVSGERSRGSEAGSESFRSERYFGKFERSVTLPVAVDSAKVSATYKDGILTVVLPKSEEAKPRQIDVNVG